MDESPDAIPPDLQAAVLCEDVRQEMGGGQTLIGVLNVIPAPVVPIGLFKLCLWARWCGGTGHFDQESFLLGCDDDEPLASSKVAFHLPALDSHATNVHVFGGIQFPKHGIYHVEIRLDGSPRLRFALPVVAVPQNQPPA